MLVTLVTSKCTAWTVSVHASYAQCHSSGCLHVSFASVCFSVRCTRFLQCACPVGLQPDCFSMSVFLARSSQQSCRS